jgi:hypothetical protein
MTQLFNEGQPVEDPNQKFYDTLVGEGKKFKDNEALAFAKIKSDEHIARLEAEKRDLEKDLNSRLPLEELLEKIQQAAPKQPAQAQDNPLAQQQAPQGNLMNAMSGKEALSKEDVAKLVQESLSQETTKRTQERNEQLVAQKLTEVWGPNFSATLLRKAQELNMDKNTLTDIARKHPDAFIKMVGAADPKEQVPNFTPPRNQQNSAGNVGVMNNGTKTFSAYEKLRKENARVYWSGATQQQMFKDAQTLGPDFYK